VYPRVTFILGGAASGKSIYAESMVENIGKTKTYLATSQIVDHETDAKIARHKARRGANWVTIEAPLDLGPALAGLNDTQVCLLDCATMWLSNHLLAGHDIPMTQTALLGMISDCRGDLVIVSNEVGQGIVPDNALARQFREAQGRLNIALAAQADTVVQVIAGLPLMLKGEHP